MKNKMLICIVAVLATMSAQSCMIRVNSPKGNLLGREVVKGSSRDGERTVTGVQEFTKVSLAGSYIVHYSYGEPKVVLTGADNVLDKINVESNGDKLEISTKKGVSILEGRIRVELCSKSLSEVNLAGSGKFSVEGLDEASLKLSVAGAGDMSLDNCKAGSLNMSIAGSGEMDVEDCIVDDLSLSIAGAGDFDIENIEAKEISGSIAGAGNISVSGRADKARFKIAGSGKIDTDGFDCPKVEIKK